MPHPLTGSGLARAHACPPSCALPAVGSTGNADTRRGNGGHRYLELLVEGREQEAAEHLRGLPLAERQTLSALNLAEIPRGQTEVSFAFNVRSGRARVLSVGERCYDGVEDDEIAGTADVVVVDAGTVRIIDWKFSRVDFDVDLAAPQLEFYALCATRVHGLSSASCSIGIVLDTGEISWRTWSLGAADLIEVARRTRRTFQSVESARAARAAWEASRPLPWVPDVTTGAHCRYCPAAGYSCPAHIAAVRAAVGEIDVASPLAVGDAYLRAREVELWAEHVREVARIATDMHGALPTSTPQVVRRDGAGRLRVYKVSGKGA